MATAQKIRCQIEQIQDHGEHVYTLALRPEKRLPLFRPGQFLHLTLEEYDPSSFWPESRVFSIASSPARRDQLQIVYSVQGRFTARMEKELAVGKTLWVKLPYGEFVIENTRPVALFAGGTGLTAFTAFLESLPPVLEHPLYLFYGARRPNLLLYAPLLNRLAQTTPQFRVTYFVEQLAEEKALTAGMILGRLSVAATWSQIENPLAAHYYLSGPPVMRKALTQDLRAQGLPPTSIHTDAWE